MKDCNYFREQIFLMLYDEKYDEELTEHLKKCSGCSIFLEETKRTFFLPLDSNTKSDLSEIKQKISGIKRNIFNFSFYNNFKRSISAAVIFFVISTSFYYIKIASEKDINATIKITGKSSDTYVITSVINGGEKKTTNETSVNENSYTLDSIENAISDMENELNSILEVDYYEII